MKTLQEWVQKRRTVIETPASTKEKEPQHEERNEVTNQELAMDRDGIETKAQQAEQNLQVPTAREGGAANKQGVNTWPEVLKRGKCKQWNHETKTWKTNQPTREK